MTLAAFSPVVGHVYPASPDNYTHAIQDHRIFTLHDVECPPGVGWVQSLMGPSYFGNPSAEVSIHLMADAATVGQGAVLGQQCWHVGGPGNQLADGLEQAGYATFTKAMWLGTEKVGVTYRRPNGAVVAWTAADNVHMASQFRLVANVFAEIHRVRGIPLRWLTLAEVRQAHDDYEAGRKASVTGFNRHRDWTLSGGSATSHTDPGDNYPVDELMTAAVLAAGGSTGGTSAPKPKPTTPATYTVRKGDTLSAIAADVLGDAGRYMDIARANNLSDPNRISVGQVLKIPGGTTPSKPAPPAKPKPPAYPLPVGYWFGPLSGPAKCISGLYKTDKPEWRDGLRRWQQRMQDRGWKITPTGTWNDQTAAVAKAFKAEKGLKSTDATVGRAAWNAAWTEPVT